MSEVVAIRHAAMNCLIHSTYTGPKIDPELIESTIDFTLTWQIHVDGKSDGFRSNLADFAFHLCHLLPSDHAALTSKVSPKLSHLLGTEQSGRFRVISEWTSGFLRFDPSADLLNLLEACWRAVDAELITLVWKPAISYIYKNVSSPDSTPNSESVEQLSKLTKVIFKRPFSSSESSLDQLLTVKLLTSIYRNIGHAIWQNEHFLLFTPFLSSPYNNVRTAASHLVSHWTSHSPDLFEASFDTAEFLQPIKLQKSLISWLQAIQNVPIITDFWESFIYCYERVLQTTIAEGDVDLQNAAKLLISSTSWTRGCDSELTSDIFEACIDYTKNPLYPSALHKKALSFATAFLARYHLLLGSPPIGMLLELTFIDSVDIQEHLINFLQCFIVHYPGNAPSLADTCIAELSKPSVQPSPYLIQASALIRAFPYDIPSWAPSLLSTLPRYLGNTANRTSSLVRKLFADFKRTHADAWHLHKEQFTPHQLDIISEILVGPSYYA